jgi:chromosome segregation ATPase
MVLAMLLLGFLCGVALSVTLALFAILSMDGRFTENLACALAECRAWLTGGRRRQTPQGPARSPETDARVRGLQEEVKVMQRLIEQGRGERQAHVDAAAKVAEEVAGLRAAAGKRDEERAALEKELHERTAQVEKLREELAARAAELARSEREARDLQTELSVAASGAGLGIDPDEVARLRRERDALAARVRQLQAVPAERQRDLSTAL